MLARSLLTIFLISHCAVGFAQKAITGSVVDKKTGKGIAYATVTLVSERAGANANEKGEFNLNFSKGQANDTLLFTAIGYLTSKRLLNDFKDGSTIELQEEVKSLNEVKIAPRKEKILGKYNYGGKIYLTLHGQIVKKFKTSSTPLYLQKVYIERDPKYLGTDPKTRFLLKIYDINPKFGSPGKLLCKETILVQDDKNYDITIDVSKYHILIPNSEFFVGIEKLHTPYNERYGLTRYSNEADTEDGMAPANYYIAYEPTMLAYHSDKAECWFLNVVTRKWRKEKWEASIKVGVL